MKKMLVLFMFCCVALQSLAFADNELFDSLKKDSITFNTAYLKGQYTNKQLTNFNLELLNLSDRACKASRNLHEPVKFLTTVLLVLINSGAMVALHEIGHALRLKSFGSDYTLLIGDRDIGQNYFLYLSHQVFKGGLFGGATKWSPDQQSELEESLSKNSFQNYNIIVGAGGMNNEMYFAEKIADDIYERERLSAVNWWFYLGSRLNPSLYDKIADSENRGHDPTSIIHAFKEKGRDDFKRGTISKAGIVSLLLSATTYSIFYAICAKTKEPLTLCGFRLPDVFPYITTKGMSYKVVSGYKVNKDLNLIFGFERVFEVEPATECSLGINRTAKIARKLPISYKTIATFGQGLDLEASCSVPLSEYLSIGVGCEVYSVKSLQGQRHATSNMKKGKGCSSNMFAFVSYRY